MLNGPGYYYSTTNNTSPSANELKKLLELGALAVNIDMYFLMNYENWIISDMYFERIGGTKTDEIISSLR